MMSSGMGATAVSSPRRVLALTACSAWCSAASAPAGVGVALAAAVLFGASTPFAKVLLGQLPPVLLAGLLYLDSGLGLTLLYCIRRRNFGEAPLTRADLPWLAGATFFGGMLGPVLLTVGLSTTPASTASLLSTWRESPRRCGVVRLQELRPAGMVLIVAGGALLSWPSSRWLEAPPRTAVSPRT